MENPLKIYLGDLTYNTVTLATEAFPLNVAYIGSYCKKLFGSDVEITLFKYIEKIEDAVANEPPDILGLSNYCWSHNVSYEIFKLCKEKNPNAVNIWGGPNFPLDSPSQIKFMKKYSEVDVYIPTEGEIGFSNVVKRVLDSNQDKNSQSIIRKDPIDKNEIILAAFSCNSNKDRGDRENYIKNINHIDPDILFFAGDQSYDHKEHTAAWLKFGIQFREIFRERPCITIPDDHDIGQGNLWGENGKIASSPAGNDGGYFYDKDYVKMVERAQTSHLPDPFDTTSIEQGIGVYYTNLILGGIDFAIIEDRKFKSGPKGKIPQQGPRPDHIRNPNYDPKSVDVEGLTLLGERQLYFLEKWGSSKEKSIMKCVLSQTGFCGGAHLHGSKDNRLHADMDSNGWPQSGRNKALKLIKKANAIHVGGDQHISTVIQHGIEKYEDGPWAFIVPAIVNDYYSRWWWPENKVNNEIKNSKKLPWTGRYLDGFNNKITMHAYANPDTDSNGAGYGIIKFNKKINSVTFECWPRFQNIKLNSAKQFKGWPITVSLN